MSLFARKFGHRISTEDASPERNVQASAEISRAGLSGEEVEQIVEVERVAAEGELLTEEMDVLTEERQGLEAYRDAIRATLSEGGLTPQAASMVRVGLEGFERRIGLKLSFPSTESFGSHSDRLSMTELSLENAFTDGLKKIWKAIQEAISKAWNWILKLFGKGKEESKKLREKFKELKDREIKGSIPSDEKGVDASSYKETFRDEKAAITNNKDLLKYFDTQSKVVASIGAAIGSKEMIEAIDIVDKIDLKGNDVKEVFNKALQMKKDKKIILELASGFEFSGKVPEANRSGVPSDATVTNEGVSKSLFKGIRMFKIDYTKGEESDTIFGEIQPEKDDKDYADVKIAYVGSGDIKTAANNFYRTLEAYEKLPTEFEKRLVADIKQNEELLAKATEEDKKALDEVMKQMQHVSKLVAELSKLMFANFVSGASKAYDYLDKSAKAHKES